MPEQTISCPHCGQSIPLTQALTHQIESAALAKVEQKKAELEKAQQQLEVERRAQAQLVDEQVRKQLETEKRQLWARAQSEAAKQQDTKTKDLEAQVAEKDKKLAEAQQQELELRKRQRQLEEKEQALELETQRKIDQEREKIRVETQKQEAERSQLSLQEKDKQLDIMRKTIEDLRRQGSQGSQQVQGEVGEDWLKQTLNDNFIQDLVEDVATGKLGGDILQRIQGRTGRTVATILWESKRTKAFAESWLDKLKSDQGLEKAEVAVLVTPNMPKDMEGFGTRKGVWITTPQFAVALATTLRLQLIEIAKVKQSLEGQDEKMTSLYRYLTGAQFKNRVENLVMSFMAMKSDLETERNSLKRIWSKREKEIERMISSTAQMYGDLEGIVGGALPSIQQLELSSVGSNTKELLAQNTADSLFDET